MEHMNIMVSKKIGHFGLSRFGILTQQEVFQSHLEIRNLTPQSKKKGIAALFQHKKYASDKVNLLTGLNVVLVLHL